MKVKTTKKSVKNAFNKIYEIGYCKAQYLTYFKNPFAYSSGAYGWSCDYYNIDGICISTGYNAIGENVPYDILNKYEKKAQTIIRNYDLDYQKRKTKVNRLLVKLIGELNKNN
jgi:hypothetical protein